MPKWGRYGTSQAGDGWSTINAAASAADAAGKAAGKAAQKKTYKETLLSFGKDGGGKGASGGKGGKGKGRNGGWHSGGDAGDKDWRNDYTDEYWKPPKMQGEYVWCELDGCPGWAYTSQLGTFDVACKLCNRL